MDYHVRLFASNNHEELQNQINQFFKQENIHIEDVEFVADGAEFTYCIAVVYLPVPIKRR